ncbi:MFS transporter [Paludisphaera soli]|uniref:MFS transporter n=1 Tax=Paludisphaera soli TaxID=2712865 RepID=UPI0013EBFF88|nr:MFS transporter [Paludisphaera soli]
MTPAPLERRAKAAVLTASLLGIVLDGAELGLMPVASLSVSRSLLGDSFTPTLGGDWFARFTAALMLGAAIGGIALGALGDRIGRARGMGLSILIYSTFAGLGAWVTTQEQMLLLRFLVGLGVGGIWPNSVALVSECWPGASRPLVAGMMAAGLNSGILVLSQVARAWPITPDSWRWLFQLAGAPVLLGAAVLAALPESPAWLASRGSSKGTRPPLRELFGPSLRRATLTGIAVSAVPMVGAWAASKWMIPWADKVAGVSEVGYKAATQGWWALGAVLGSFAGAQVAARLGRRRGYMLISVSATLLTVAMFQLTAPLRPSFHPIVFAQGLVATLYFGWLTVYLPELFPTRVRATGSGLAYNCGRFATAGGVLMAGVLFTAMGGDYARVGALSALIYALGLLAIAWAPDGPPELEPATSHR